MNVRRPAAILLAILISAALVPATSRYMPVDEVKPGMEAVGRTVFQGITIEEFKVHIIGVLRNIAAPKRDLILARIEGGPLAKTGVIAGMSGSPVYVDGRLVGALSYSMGQFATEPIAGITPIEEMLAATNRRGTEAAPRSAPRWAEMAAAMARSALPSFGRLDAFAAGASQVLFTGQAGTFDVAATSYLKPIAMPLVTAGFSLDSMPVLADMYRNSGFALAPGGSGAGMTQPQVQAVPEPLKPGDPVGVALMTGDLSFGATGTVTEVDGDRVYAFGHPFYNVGPARFPMTRAYVHTVLPSLLSSMKLSSIGEIIGTVRQDRATAIAGTLGAPPRMIDVNLVLTSEGGSKRNFRFGVAVDPLLSPLLVYTALFSTISSYERDFGGSTYALRGRIAVAGHSPVEFDDVFAGDQPATPASALVALPIGTLLNNDREAVEIQTVDLTVQSAETPRTATIERVWIDSTNVRRGRTVPVNILLRTWRGEDVLHKVDVTIPLNAEGPLSLLVSDGPRLAQWESRDGRPMLGPDSVEALIHRLNETRRANRLYVRLVGRNDGAIVGNETLPSLPSSVLNVLGSDRAGGSGSPVQNATLGAWEIQTPMVVSGQRTISVLLADRNHRP